MACSSCNISCHIVLFVWQENFVWVKVLLAQNWPKYGRNNRDMYSNRTMYSAPLSKDDYFLPKPVFKKK